MTKITQETQRWRVLEDRPGGLVKLWGTIEAPTRKAAERQVAKQPCWKGKTLRVELHQ